MAGLHSRANVGRDHGMIAVGDMVGQLAVQMAVLAVGCVCGGIVIGFLSYPRIFRGKGRHVTRSRRSEPAQTRSSVAPVRRPPGRDGRPASRSWDSRTRWP